MKHRLLLILVVLSFGLIAPANAQTPRYARVISENANLRDTPSIASGSEQEIVEGTIVKVLDEKLPWYVVRAGNRVGWMHGNSIEFLHKEVSGLGAPSQQTVAPAYVPSTPSPHRVERSPQTSSPTTVSRGYIRGPRGGCYYYSASGRKVYVDRSLCN
jgi:hypothetical protein